MRDNRRLYGKKLIKYMNIPIAQAEIDTTLGMFRFCPRIKGVIIIGKNPEVGTEDDFGMGIAIRVNPFHGRPDNIVSIIGWITLVGMMIFDIEYGACTTNKFYVARMAIFDVQ